jgi:hypothetical protein
MIAPTTEAEATAAVGWDDPVPFDAADAPPPFPVDALPDTLARFVEGTARSMGMPPDLLGLFSLTALSAVTGGRWKIQIDPSRPEWIDPVVIYGAGIAPPGSMKTACMSAATRPLVAIERELAEQYGPDVEVAASARRIEEKRLAALENQAAAYDSKKGAAETDPKLLAEDLARDLATTPVPVVPEIFTTDATPEKIEALLADNGGRFAWLSDEGGLFTMAAGRYSANKGAGASLDTFKNGHSGGVVKVHRKSRPTVNIESAALTIGIATQPSHLMSAARNRDLMGQGLFARFLFSWPDMGPVDRSQPGRPTPAGVAEAYARTVKAVHQKAETLRGGEPQLLTAGPEVTKALRPFMAWIYENQQPGGGLAAPGLDEWAGKLAGQTGRLAAIITLANDPDASTVTVEAAEGAVALARYFAAHARRAFLEVDLLPEVSEARRCWQAIQGAKPRGSKWKEWPAVVSTRDVHDDCRTTPGLETSAAVSAALTRLAEEYHLLRPVERPEGKGGRPSERWEVHPDYRGT